ncbi:MAG: type II toxin-antitoxin system PemK/MazF family toxin [Galactobacter sp.]|uniref:type II toxin-antitoxin system PemK/MazF family toxin n=1 Tax=Galactobacter sp. TaxID=2676125 RepID=UPI0025C48CF6|nr:type II toxin-antitoxin system PemK/MazF family toxin [Galactobacter sp.]
MAKNGWGRLARTLLKPVLREAKRSLSDQIGAQQRKSTKSVPDERTAAPHGQRQGAGSPRPATTPSGSGPSGGDHGAYAGDFTGRVKAQYAPHPDGDADPGEIVWAWVPYEEDHRQGKDRPTLIVGRDGQYLLGLMLTSKEHTDNGNPNYLDLGTGDWDKEGRPSEVKLDRVLRLDESAVRREGAVLDRTRFDRVAAALSARR